MPYCAVCNETAALVGMAITWAQYEGWRGAIQVLRNSRAAHYRFVLWSELDIFFQTDPFRIPHSGDPDFIHISASPYTTIGTDPWGFWLSKYNSSCCFEQLKDKTIPFVNSGLILGSRSSMLALLEILMEHWHNDNIAQKCCWQAKQDPGSAPLFRHGCVANVTACRDTIFGQTALNYVLHLKSLPFPVHGYEFPFTTPLCSIGTFSMPLDALGNVLVDVGGSPCAVVHMYNRYHIRAYDGTMVPYSSLFDTWHRFYSPAERLLFPGNVPKERYGIFLWTIEYICRRAGQVPWLCREGATSQKCMAGDVSPECKPNETLLEYLYTMNGTVRSGG